MRTRLIALAAMLASAMPGLAHAQTAPGTATSAPADPVRLAAAEKAVAALVPKGIYMTMMRDKVPQLMDAVMGQMMGKKPGEMGLPPKDGADPNETMGQTMAKADPAYEERMRIGTKVMFEEMGTLFDAMEPRVRAGLARAFARKFTLAQLNDFNTFFATPSGSVFAHEYLLTFMDPELMQEMMSFVPEMMKAMPAIMDKTQKATAHLPPPPKPSEKAKTDD